METLAWLYRKTGDQSLLNKALRIADYSYSNRGSATNLIINEPDKVRWDVDVSTTEVGVWTQSLFRAAEYAAEERFVTMARTGVEAYLKYGYDQATNRFYGRLHVKDGLPDEVESEEFRPGTYADIWNMGQWPHHDYPMPFAEACITLYQKTGNELFREAVYRWADIVSTRMPARDGQGAYAVHYGRCIHFLARAGRVFEDARLTELARSLANEALQQLAGEEMLRGDPSTPRYRSVDGVGFLCLALLQLETNEPLNLYGFGF